MTMEYVSKSDILNAQAVKNAVVSALISEGFLEVEKGAEFLSKYAVIYTHRSWFQMIYDKCFSKQRKDSNNVFVDVVKFVNLDDATLASINGAITEDIAEITTLSVLKDMLVEAEKNEQFERARKIQKRIDQLNTKS